MNLMILSPGRRVEIVNYFKKEIHKTGGKVYTADMTEYAPALYVGDKHFILDKDFNNLDKYINDIISICKEFNINSVISLIDPELELLSNNIEKFLDNNITPIVSKKEVINNTFDKYNFYLNYENILNVVKTYNGYKDIKDAINKNEISFPIFVKLRNGSGSAGTGKINNEDELNYYKDKENYIFQPFIKYKEFGIDVYFDIISGKIVSLFMKDKIAMRSGETDKAVSVFREDVLKEIMKLENICGFRGPIDVDIFEDGKGRLYVNEINPRFGGGYPHAYNCGVDFIKNIINNLNGVENKNQIGNYENGITMMKYNGIMFKKDDTVFYERNEVVEYELKR